MSRPSTASSSSSSTPATESRSTPDTAFDLTISFAAGGWFQMYHFGVCKALLDTQYLETLRAAGKRIRFCGSSAGSLAAASLASGCHMHDDMKDFALICGEHYRESWLHFLCMREYLTASIQRFGDHMMETPEQTEATLRGMSKGQLEVYTTTLPFLQRKCITTFKDLDDVEEALIASCCLSPVVGLPFPLRESGEWVCDGGFRSFQPRVSEPNTLTVSPFYFTSADIRPSTAVPVWWGLFPPPRKEHERLFATGYNDCVEFLVTSGRVPKEMSVLLMTCDSQTHHGHHGSSDVPDKKEWSIFQRVIVDFLIALMYILVLKPLAIAFIYLEMVLVSILLGFLYIVARVRGASSDWRPIYETFRNMISLRVFLRLLFGGSKIPINESRLSKRSTLFRAFQPLVFERGRCVRTSAAGHRTQGETPSKKKRFIVDAHWNMHQHWLNFRNRGAGAADGFDAPVPPSLLSLQSA